jgi:predicted SprT family Zn-dependent metalloprotease
MSHFKFGKLKMKFPAPVSRASGKRVLWVCDCGNEVLVSIIDVLRGHTASCGKCGILPQEFWEKTKFGRLRLLHPQSMTIRSNRKMEWHCDCGEVLTAVVENVTTGRTTCCGKCRNNVDEWFIQNRSKIRMMKPPIQPSDLPSGSFTILDTVTRTADPIRAICGVCGAEYFPRWDHVRSGVALTCGCSTNRVSKGQQELADFIHSLGVNVLVEHKIGKLAYDIFVPEANIAVEFQGIKWHSVPGSKQRDMAKYRNAENHGVSVIAIFEDEWQLRRKQISQLVSNRLRKNFPTHTLRASSVLIRHVPSTDANKFYEAFHYIGKCRATVSYGAFVNDIMVACCSFSRPTRQSSHPWELVRMSSNSDYRVHGIWSKILHHFINDFHPTSIVSFSDNRVFVGRVYDKLGFKHDGNVPQSYYWAKGGKRFNKSGLRKHGLERNSQVTETQLREFQGFNKIWDLGKKRWVWRSQLQEITTKTT